MTANRLGNHEPWIGEHITERWEDAGTRIAHRKKPSTARQKISWEAATIIERTAAHLSRYERMLMLHATWHPELIPYQLVDIPLELLRLIRNAEVEPV